MAAGNTLVIPDLPGYGGSRLRDVAPRWTKRRDAVALVALMRALGHVRFALAGHDRGARAAYRLVLDHPGTVTRFASLAVVPTPDALAAVDAGFAHRNFHWFLLAQAACLPEQLLAAAPDEFMGRGLATMGAESDTVIEAPARAAYLAAFPRPGRAACDLRGLPHRSRRRSRSGPNGSGTGTPAGPPRSRALAGSGGRRWRRPRRRDLAAMGRRRHGPRHQWRASADGGPARRGDRGSRAVLREMTVSQ
jgi:pimeloyl-ACP methyl ester carboxylesterase